LENQEIDLAKVKRNLVRVPKARLDEVNDFIEFLLSKSKSSRLRRVAKLEGIWQGLGFEQIPDLGTSIRDIRGESEKSILKRAAKCAI
jgi:hypothetical protein